MPTGAVLTPVSVVMIFFFLNYVYDIPLRETYSTKSSVNACCDSSYKRSFCFLYHSSTYRRKSTQGWGTHAVSSYQIADVLKHSSGLWFQTHKSHVIEEFRQVVYLSKLLDHVM